MADTQETKSENKRASSSNETLAKPKLQLLGRWKIQPGQQLFGYNKATKEVLELGRPRKVVVQDNIIYRVALNKKNFLRKLEREAKFLRHRETEKD